MPESNELKTIRENLMTHGLSEVDAPADPMSLFNTWMAYAEELKFHNANAMTLGTVNERSEPSLRNVLLRGHADGSFAFYTNYESRKGRDLAQKETAAALLGWLELERQIRLTGTVEKMKPESSDRYFSGRDRGSRISAVVSNQSHPVRDRRELEDKWRQLDSDLGDASPERPAHWGGYVLIADSVEFWQGRPHRLHDRLLYTRTGKTWRLERLAP
jgi:pyridoxamine 5'-phosphate oxidase